MRKIEFYKLQASGNDFILIDNRKQSTLRLRSVRLRSPQAGQAENRKINYKDFANKHCSRKFGVGGDGLLVIESSKKADFKMRIFNPDGSEPDMCGNGARCVALWRGHKETKTQSHKLRNIDFETKAGIIESEVRSSGEVRIKLSDPFDLKLDLPLKVSGRKLKVNYINTGVPHAVVFVQGLEEIDADTIGREIRFHKRFQPAGTNVNFVEVTSKDSIKIRTYERGVEAETLACGTGVAASAIITDYRLQTIPRQARDLSPRDPERQRGADHRRRVSVLTKSGEVLKVYFDRKDTKVTNVWLEGKAYLVYKGEVILKV